MKLEFSDFHPLSDLAQVNIRGELNLDWDRQYEAYVRGNSKYQQPSTGSGFSVLSPRLFATDMLPNDLQHQIELAVSNGGNGWIYILRSNQHNILYVGISEKTLATGVFGDGRFRHHLRKLLAATGGATNHTKGWHKHATERYAMLCELAHQSDRLDHALLVSDLHIAVAHVADPKRYEKFVLEKYAKTMNTPIILNSASNGSADLAVALELPQNAPSGSSEPDNFEPFDLEEAETYEQADSAHEDYAEHKMSEDWRNQFMQVLMWARHTFAPYDLTITEGVIRGLQEQPDGYNGTPLVGFARRNINGRSMPHGWFARIPLESDLNRPMTVILPLRLKADGLSDDKISPGQDANFRPLELTDFLQNPEHYIDLSKDDRTIQ